jgi:hypothetical protein
MISNAPMRFASHIRGMCARGGTHGFQQIPPSGPMMRQQHAVVAAAAVQQGTSNHSHPSDNRGGGVGTRFNGSNQAAPMSHTSSNPATTSGGMWPGVGRPGSCVPSPNSIIQHQQVEKQNLGSPHGPILGGSPRKVAGNIAKTS